MSVQSSLPEVFGDFEGLDKPLFIDTSDSEPSYLLRHKNGAHIKLSASAYFVLTRRRAGVSYEDIAREVVGADRVPICSPADLERAYERIVLEIEIIQKSAKNNLPFGFWGKITLLPRDIVARIVKPMTVMYSPAIGVFVVICTLLATLLSTHGLVLRFPSSDSAFTSAYSLFLLSLLVHECGHAAASMKYDVVPGDIGFAVYLIYPAFYTDVTSSWRLSRWRRVIVDLGGNYFQCAVGSIYCVAYYVTHWEAWHLAFLMILYSVVFSLNPMFKFDGYWVMADALGVTNLSQQPGKLLRHAIKRLAGSADREWPWPRRTGVVLVAYSILSIGIWLYFIYRLLPSVWSRMLSVNHQMAELFKIRADHAAAWHAFVQLMITLGLLTLSLYGLFRVGQRLCKMAIKSLHAIAQWLRARAGHISARTANKVHM